MARRFLSPSLAAVPLARLVGALGVVLTLLGPAAVQAEPAAGTVDDDGTRRLSREEIEAWLDSRSLQGAGSELDDEDVEVPPPPPPKRGFVVETSIGGLGHLGPLGEVSPPAPWLRLQLGYEAFGPVMLFGAAETTFANTSFGNPPPGPRGYALIGFSGGVRATWRPLRALGLYLQGELGFAGVDEDVLATYGFREADTFNVFYAGSLGVEWYQVSPHLALTVLGSVRTMAALERVRVGRAPLAIASALALRYAF